MTTPLETPISVGIVGLGRAGWMLHLEPIQKLPGFQITAVADPLAERREEAASLTGCATFSSLDELLEDIRRQYLAHYRTLLSGEIAALRRHWSALDETVGKTVLVESTDGTWRGRAASLDEHGALWVEDVAGGQRRVVVGDVSITFQD